MATDIVSQLIGPSIRICGLALVAFVGISIFRLRSSAARHAMWTVVLIGMLLQIPLEIVAPPILLKTLPILPASTQARVMRSARPSRSAARATAPETHAREPVTFNRTPCRTAMTLFYLVTSLLLFLRLALGCWGLRKIVRGSMPIPSLGPNVFEVTRVVVPGSVGGIRARILLPRAWRDWNAAKLGAVLAHERAHIQRYDWFTHLASRLTICIFWFHPLAWWIDRELARLAEEACDDVAVSETKDKEEYAATLVDIARGAASSGGVLGWSNISMATGSNVTRRVNRVLSRGLEVPRPFGRLAWATLLACSLPVIYLSSAVKIASASRDSRVLGRVVVRPPDEARVIVDIRVHGNRSVSRDVILAHMLNKIGDIFDPGLIERDFNSLWNTGFFADLRFERTVTPKGWILHVYVKERPSEQITDRIAGQKSSRTLIAQTSPDLDPGPASLPEPREDPPPIAMCIIIDSSGSMDDKRDERKAAALTLVNAATPHEEFCILSFDDEVFNTLPNDEDFTSNIKEITEAVSRIDARGGKAMRDAVQTGIDRLGLTTHNERKVIVLITEGYDTSSKVSQEELLGKAKSSGVPIYCIGLLSENDSQRRDAARLALSELADASGGLALYAETVAEVESISRQIGNDAGKR
jgi:BlaR1 peptidase M56/von Willebrand factor type A domain/Surface antigen variable number repeat